MLELLLFSLLPVFFIGVIFVYDDVYHEERLKKVSK
jgi:hypothetical protein